MTRTIFTIGVVALMAASCVHNATTATSAGDVVVHHAMDTGTLPGGAVLEGRLDHSLTAATARIGDAFSVTLASDAVTKRHATVVPAGAVVYGHITRLDLTNNSGAVATVQLAFDSLVFAGRHHVLDANISKIGATGVSLRPAEVQHPSGTDLPASVTLLSFANAEGQLPAGSTVTLVVTNPILLEP